MSSEWIVGTLAFVTIGLVVLMGIYHFGVFLRDPRNRGAAKNVLQHDGESATTKVRSNTGPAEGTLRERLDS